MVALEEKSVVTEMNLTPCKSLFTALITVLLLSFSLNTSAGPLKPTMKEMRLHYKQAIKAESPEQFNREIQLFIEELHTAQAFNFSPERKDISLEGLNKVEQFLTELPLANTANLSKLQQDLKQVDQLREEYHDKAKPGIWDLLLDALKQAMN